MNFSVDEDLLKQCLEKARPNCEILVRRYEREPDTVKPGTNYSSEIFRLRVEYECDGRRLEERLLFKVPTSSTHFEFLIGLGFYDKETYMYDKVLPAIGEMLSSAVVPRHFLTAANHTLALEDLTAYGYRLRTKGALDAEHSKCVLQALAMFHAASVKLQRRDAALLVPASHEALYTRDIVEKVTSTCYPVLIDILRREDVSAEILQNFAAYQAKINRADICHISHRLRQFDVLNHGDLKTNNILFKYGDDAGQQPTAVKFVDYQTCRWKSPVLDLVFLNMATVDYAVYYEKHGDQLLDRYLRTLNETLGKLGCKCAYTEDEYRADMDGCELFQVFTLVWIGLLDCREINHRFDYVHGIQLRPHEIEEIRKNEIFRNRFLKWFRHLEKLGLFS